MDRRSGKRGIAFFDIDGTITENSIVSQVMARSIHALRLQPIHLEPTFITGRTTINTLRILDTLGQYRDKILTPRTLIAVENGARIIDRQGRLIEAFPISPLNILPLLVHYVNQETCDLITFSQLPSQKVQVVIYDKLIKEKFPALKDHDLVDELDANSNIADYLKEKVKERNVTLISIIPKENQRTRIISELMEQQVVFTQSPGGTIYFNHIGHSKATAAAYIAGRMKLPLRDSIAVANDMNDLAMLSLPFKGVITVGFNLDGEERLARRVRPEGVGTPKDLERYLIPIVTGMFGL